MALSTRATAALGAATIAYAALSFPSDADAALRRALARAAAWGFVLVAWPVAWTELMSGCASLANVAFLWPYVIMALDTHWASHFLLPSASGVAVQIDPSVVCSLAFMLSGLVGASESPTRSKLFVVALLTYLLLVVPKVTDADPESERVALVEAAQRAVFACVTALLVGALLFDGRCAATAPGDTAAARTARTARTAAAVSE